MSRGRILVRRLAVLGCGAAAFPEATALGDELATAQLTYVANNDAAEHCPDEESFRHQIAARLGYQPFTSDGKHRVAVTLNAARGRVRVRAEVTRSGQTASGVRELDDKIDKCEALASALATTVAIAIDPVRGLGPVPPPIAPAQVPHDDRDSGAEHLAPPLSPPPPSLPRQPAQPTTPSRPILFFAGAGGLFSFGVAPGPALGVEAGLGARRDAFSLELSARLEAMPESARAASGDRLEATVLSGTLLPCGQLGVFVGCVWGRVGAFQGRAPDVVTPSLGTTVFGAIGLRAGIRLVVWRWISMQAMAEAGLPLVRTSLLVGPTTVWTAPPGFAGASVSALVLFP